MTRKEYHRLYRERLRLNPERYQEYLDKAKIRNARRRQRMRQRLGISSADAIPKRSERACARRARHEEEAVSSWEREDFPARTYQLGGNAVIVDEEAKGHLDADVKQETS